MLAARGAGVPPVVPPGVVEGVEEGAAVDVGSDMRVECKAHRVRVRPELGDRARVHYPPAMNLFVEHLPPSPRRSARLLAGRQAVVIDALRASATITQALQAGAACVVPCLEVEDARILADASSRTVLGGERGGQKIDGFDLGNSPREYTPRAVRAKTVVFTTTNGTRALLACSPAARVLVGCVNHATVLCDTLWRDGRDVVFVAAGTNGRVSEEDSLSAGLLAGMLFLRGAALSRSAHRAVVDTIAALRRRSLHRAFAESRGGRTILSRLFPGDLAWCSAVDTHTVVGVWEDGRIRPATSGATERAIRARWKVKGRAVPAVARARAAPRRASRPLAPGSTRSTRASVTRRRGSTSASTRPSPSRRS